MDPSLRAHAHYPLLLLGIVVLTSIATLWAPPAGRVSWLLEVGPMLVFMAVLGAIYRRVPLSHLAYTAVLLHFFILVYGGVYTYAETPLGNWAKQAFDLSRNHYDRVGHLALGVFPCIVVRELLLRQTPLRPGGWFIFLANSVILAIAAFWELLEWWVALIASPETGTAFLGSQGDVWDAQWDMLLALVGSALTLPLVETAHDRSMARVPASLRASAGQE
jgi:putative membrane protein